MIAILGVHTPSQSPNAVNLTSPTYRPICASVLSSSRRSATKSARCDDVGMAEGVDGAGTVVAAAVVRDGRVLAQQRAYPPEAAGRWELPGGRLEPAESAADALVRECREELAVEVVPGEQLGPDVPLPGGYLLRVHTAWLAQPTATPVPVEHAALRWVDVTELAGLDWLDADRAVLPDLETWLRAQGAGAEDGSG